MNFRQTSLFAAFALTAGVVGAGAAPSQPAKPLSEILRGLDKSYVTVSEVSFEAGYWEIEAEHNQMPVEIRVEPVTAAVLSERADSPHDPLPADVVPLAEVVKQLEQAGNGPIQDIDLEGAVWDVETLRNGLPRELTVDVRTGKVLSDRADD